jgi:RNA polymerase sigma-70 factor (ECF subfamily)
MTDPVQRALDEWLVAQATAGGRGAFDPLVARWHGKFLRHAYRVLGDPDLARDVVQDAWLEILRGLPRLNDGAAFREWAYRIVTRRCAKAIKRAQRQRRLDASIERAAEGDSSRPPSPGSTDAALDARALRAALAILPPEQRVAVDLFYLDDMSVSAIAVALDVPAGTVKTRLMHARRKLRQALQGEGR